MLEAGANVNEADRNGNTPLMSSLNGIVLREEVINDAMIERFEIAPDYGASANARNHAGQSVLSFARKTKSAALIELLRQRGAK